MSLTMRMAAPSDLLSVNSITESAYSVWIPVLGYPPLPVTDDHAPRIARGEVLLACEQEKVLGLIVVEAGDDCDLIFNVAVDPDHRGKGIGQGLIAEAERRTRSRGKSSMKLYTNALMASNIALYSRLGYHETGRRPNPALPVATIVDMAKSLAD